MRAQILASLIQPTTMFVTNLTYIAVVVIGAFQVLSGRLSLGVLQAFIRYIRQIGYTRRNRIEIMFDRLKDWRRVRPALLYAHKTSPQQSHSLRP